jgi:Thiolase, C-terminal domain
VLLLLIRLRLASLVHTPSDTHTLPHTFPRPNVPQAGLTLDDIDVYEINEAFASQAKYCVAKLGLDDAKVRACACVHARAGGREAEGQAGAGRSAGRSQGEVAMQWQCCVLLQLQCTRQQPCVLQRLPAISWRHWPLTASAPHTPIHHAHAS